MRKLGFLVLGGTLFAGGVLTGVSLAAGGGEANEASMKVVFENAKVAVRELTMAPGAKRTTRPRATDEVIFFCEESHYQALDASGKTSPRDRLPGTVVWHNKGEVAPTLVNNTSKTVRYYNFSLK